MRFRTVLRLWLAGALPLALVASTTVWLEPPTALAAPRPAYQVGMRLRAQQDCTVRGYAIKKGVVLSVAAVHTNDRGSVAALDLAFSGMTIAGVSVQTVRRYFSRA
jgi:hypothetical protein